MPVEKDADDMSAEELADFQLVRETKAAKDRRIKAAWEAVMADPNGRAVIWDIITRAGIHETPAVFGSVDMTFHNIGRADFGRMLYATVGKDYPARLLQMEKENMR